MPVRWRRVTSETVRVVSFGGLSPGELLGLAGPGPFVAPIRWRPPADICETPSSVIVAIELAGVREDDLDIALYPDAVIVDGHRAPESPGPEVVYHSLQIRRGRFRLEIPLPVEVDVDEPEVDFSAGILRMELAKKNRRNGHRAGAHR